MEIYIACKLNNPGGLSDVLRSFKAAVSRINPNAHVEPAGGSTLKRTEMFRVIASREGGSKHLNATTLEALLASTIGVQEVLPTPVEYIIRATHYNPFSSTHNTGAVGISGDAIRFNY